MDEKKVISLEGRRAAQQSAPDPMREELMNMLAGFLTEQIAKRSVEFAYEIKRQQPNIETEQLQQAVIERMVGADAQAMAGLLHDFCVLIQFPEERVIAAWTALIKEG